MQQDGTFEASADARFFDRTDNDQGNHDTRLSIYESRGRLRFMKRPELDGRVGYNLRYLDLDSSDPRLPDHLSDQSLAAGLVFGDVNEWRPTITVGGGYAGDDAFANGSAWYGLASVSVTRRFGQNSRLTLAVDYDGNRTIFPDIPLPSAAYWFQLPEQHLEFTVGFPFNSVVWRPMDKLTLEATALLLYRVEASARYDFSDAWSIFASYGGRKDAFHLDELDEKNDRLIFEQQTAEVGVRWTPCRHTTLVLAGGYAFEQELSVGFDSRDNDSYVELYNAPYIRFGLEVRF
jgi:hypothetical protein